MEDFRKKLHEEVDSLNKKIENGSPLTEEDHKILFLNSFLSEEASEQ
ncbi:MAG: hypothetical protein ACJAT2_002003 [Bacteriovoracaceae bacterium]|jgi:hypothetical protein